jgi:hypothetical protein
MRDEAILWSPGQAAAHYMQGKLCLANKQYTTMQLMQ